VPPAGVGASEVFFENLLASGSDWSDGSSVAASRCHWLKASRKTLPAGRGRSLASPPAGVGRPLV